MIQIISDWYWVIMGWVQPVISRMDDWWSAYWGQLEMAGVFLDALCPLIAYFLCFGLFATMLFEIQRERERANRYRQWYLHAQSQLRQIEDEIAQDRQLRDLIRQQMQEELRRDNERFRRVVEGKQ